MPIYSDREYWLGGIYVKPSYRNKGIGTQIIHQLEHRAVSLESSASTFKPNGLMEVFTKLWL